MASSSQPSVIQEISESTIPDAVDQSTEAENLPPKNVEGSDDANMSDPQPSVNQEISKSTIEVNYLWPPMLDQQPSINQEISKSTIEVEYLWPPMLDQQPSLDQEINKSTTEAKNKNVEESENANKLGDQELGKSASAIPELVDRLTTEAENCLVPKNVTVYDNANMLIEGLKEIKEFFKKSEHKTAGGAQVKSTAQILHEKVASKAEQLKAKLDELNEAVSKLKLQTLADSSQPTVNQVISKSTTIPDSVDRSTTEAEKLLLHMLDDQKKLIAVLNETRESFTNSGQKAVEAFVKTVLEWILQEPSYRLRSQEVALTAEQLKPKLDELNLIVSNLKLQLPVDSVSTASPTVSKINETIIPAVVARLELADKYSLCLSPQPDEQNDSNSGKKGGSTGEQVHKLRNDLSYIRSFLKNLEDNSNNLGHRLGNFQGGNASVFVDALLQHSAFDDLGTDHEAKAKQLQAKLGVLKKVVIQLKHQISSPNKLSPTDSDDRWYNQFSSEFDYAQALDIMPVLHVHEKFKNSSAFRDFREVYQSLELTTKLCLLCFATIPENEVVKKRFMTHWWVGEDFVSPPPGKTYEEVADGIFEELVKKNCIEPFNQKLRYVVDSYKMDPCIRSAVIVLAKEAGFFNFDGDKWNPSVNFKGSNRACLVDGFSQELLKIKNELLDPEKLQVIFNVNEPYPDVFELERFSKMKNVKVLYLGRWQTSAKHHIEVESVEFLKGLESMKLLRFFSLQGISRITKLPDSVRKLLNLRILDLRACHNLEALPVGIGSLKMLTHLDISECYQLDYMPKEIASLSELQVLKGFVISNSNSRTNCTLHHLSGLENLSKLSIYTNKEAFPKTEDVTTLVKFNALQKLTITWGAGAFQPKADSNYEEDNGGTNQPIKKLEKLDLKCYPRRTAPSWLRPGKLPKVKKLYIREGNLQSICPVQENDKWSNVEVLRLKFLSELKMDYKKLRSSFPKLTYLETFMCPKLTYFPCNENGVVWLGAMN